ncbi:hypothetical protein Gotur_030312, partial [Gossypium turneri]
MVTLVEPSFPSLLISWLKRLISLSLPLQDIFPFQMRVMVTTMAYSLTTLSTLTTMQVTLTCTIGSSTLFLL